MDDFFKLEKNGKEVCPFCRPWFGFALLFWYTTIRKAGGISRSIFRCYFGTLLHKIKESANLASPFLRSDNIKKEQEKQITEKVQ